MWRGVKTYKDQMDRIDMVTASIYRQHYVLPKKRPKVLSKNYIHIMYKYYSYHPFKRHQSFFTLFHLEIPTGKIGLNRLYPDYEIVPFLKIHSN